MIPVLSQVANTKTYCFYLKFHCTDEMDICIFTSHKLIGMIRFNLLVKNNFNEALIIFDIRKRVLRNPG